MLARMRENGSTLVRLLLGGACVWTLAGCPTSPSNPSYQYACPDQQCPLGETCGSDQLCHAATAGATGGTTGTGGSSSGGSGSTGNASTGASTGGHGTSGSGTSGGGASSGGSSSGGTSPANFAGEWDTNFADVVLTQSGTAVSGTYAMWGYTPLDPLEAGQISGTVSGDTFSGTLTDNHADAPEPVTWTLSQQHLTGFWNTTNPWCGVPHGSGALPTGCGWSDTFNIMYAQATSTMVLQQTQDEVSGTYGGSSSNTLTGVVSDFRLNGEFVSGGSGRISFYMTEDNSHISGNFTIPPAAGQTYQWSPTQWCGGRGAAGALPTTCLGGGGPFDGSWFTNLGTITLDQPMVAGSQKNLATGVWFWYGDTTEYPVSAAVAVSSANGPSIAWSDSSVLDGGQQLTTFDGLTLSNGYRNSPMDAPWCGVIVGSDSAGNPQVGALPEGCGMTSSNWVLWESQGGASLQATLVQLRNQVTGTASVGTSSAASIAGSASYDPDGGFNEGYLAVTGIWTANNVSETGVFAWYPSAFPGSFAGDLDGGASPWCGAGAGDVEPNPCLE
jgi:hypothetical protein